MPKSSKERIAETAVVLFNERGYEDVSLRDIAKEAGVAIGTLTYHFAHKEDLLQTILSDLHSEYESALDRRLGGEELLRQLAKLFKANALNQELYPFYFQDISGIARCAPSLAEEGKAFESSLLSYYAWALASLSEQGILRSDLPPATWDNIAAAMVVLQAGWSSYGCPASLGILTGTTVVGALSSLIASCAEPSKVELVESCLKAE